MGITTSTRLLGRATVVVALVAGVLGVVPSVAGARAVNYFVKSGGTGTCLSKTSPCSTITAALVAAQNRGGTIDILSKGTYQEQLIVPPSDSNVTIVGKPGVTLAPTTLTTTETDAPESLAPDNTSAVVDVEPGTTNFSLSKVAVDAGPAAASVTTDLFGVLYDGATGSLSNVAVSGTAGPGVPEGFGVDVTDEDLTTPTAANVSMTKVKATGFSKNGITCRGYSSTFPTGSPDAAVNCGITSATVTGSTAGLGDNAENGVEVGIGATATVTKSKATGASYTGDAPASCDVGDDCAAGFLVFNDTSAVTLSKNKASGNDIGIQIDGSYGQATPTISDNSVTNAATTGLAGYGIQLYQYTAGSTVEDNTANGNAGGGIVLEGSTANNPDSGSMGSVLNNTANGDAGGGVVINKIYSATVTGNTLDNEGASADGIFAEGAGDALFNGPGLVVLSSNVASHDGGGGIVVAVSGESIAADELSVDGPTITGNTTDFDGAPDGPGGIALDSSANDVISDNTADHDFGPGIALNGASYTTVSGNTADFDQIGLAMTGPGHNNEVCGSSGTSACGTGDGIDRTISDGEVAQTETIGDGGTTTGSDMLTSPADGSFNNATVGQAVTANAIPAGTTVVAYVSPTQVTLSANATATGAGESVLLTGNQLYSPTAQFTAGDVGAGVQDSSGNNVLGPFTSGSPSTYSTFIASVVNEQLATLSGTAPTAQSTADTVEINKYIEASFQARCLEVTSLCNLSELVGEGIIGGSATSAFDTISDNTMSNDTEVGAVANGPNAPFGWSGAAGTAGDPMNADWYGASLSNTISDNTWVDDGFFGAADYSGPPDSTDTTPADSIQDTWSDNTGNTGNPCDPTTSSPTCS